jgi:hypothetical protein
MSASYSTRRGKRRSLAGAVVFLDSFVLSVAPLVHRRPHNGWNITTAVRIGAQNPLFYFSSSAGDRTGAPNPNPMWP